MKSKSFLTIILFFKQLTIRYEKAIIAMAKQRVTLEVLSYHATAPAEEANKLKVQVLSVRDSKMPNPCFFSSTNTKQEEEEEKYAKKSSRFRAIAFFLRSHPQNISPCFVFKKRQMTGTLSHLQESLLRHHGRWILKVIFGSLCFTESYNSICQSL